MRRSHEGSLGSLLALASSALPPLVFPRCTNSPFPDFYVVSPQSYFLSVVSPFSRGNTSPFPPATTSRPVSPFCVCFSVWSCQPADLFDSGASGSLPRETSSLFSEGPLVVAPEKRGGQVWRERKMGFNRLVNFLQAPAFLKYFSLHNTECQTLFSLSKCPQTFLLCPSGTPPQETRGGRVRRGHRRL